MESQKASKKAGRSAAAALLGIGVLALQVLGIAAGRAEEPGRGPLAHEIARQEEIYRSRGANVPSGYVTSRTLVDYGALLPAGFCDALGSLGSSHRWLDIGAGDGQAILDYFAPEDNAAPAERCARSAGRASAVAISIEDRRTEQWQQQAVRLGDDRLRYLSGRRLRDHSREQLGIFQIITDVYGGFSYTEDLSRFLKTVLDLLDIDGVFYTMVQSAPLENGHSKPSASQLTELLDAAGGEMKVCSWLKQTGCVKVACESRSDWEAPTELIRIRKVCSDTSVARMKLLKYQAGYPPQRVFQLER